QYKRFYWDRGLFHEIVGFTGWTLFGQITTVGRNQAVTILLNQVFNPVVVAARAIAMNISSQIMVFSSNFNIGLYPPIIKSYAANDKKHMFSLISNGSKITFFLMWVFALPFFLEMETILNIWLKNPPIEAVLFTRLALVEVLINSISMPIATAARAPGRMKVYELTLGIIQIGIFVASWIALKFGGAPYSVFVVAIVANIVMFMVRLLIVRSLIGLSLRPFFREVVYPLLLMVLISTLPSFAIYYYLPEGFVYTIISILLSVIITTTSMYYIGLDKAYRNKVRSVVGNRIKKIF
ncbi:MAG TPA: polysaccharide biosynthesis protein, partial [Bacteroidales bacterium]|nr:polysaccharide biosynthesis protein [Bacteroidales bacterium]